MPRPVRFACFRGPAPAGHGAIRAILHTPRHFARTHSVLLLDGIHTSYIPDGTVLESGGTLDTTSLVAFAD